MSVPGIANLQEIVASYYAGDLALGEEAQKFSLAKMREIFSWGVNVLDSLVGAMSPAQLTYRLPGAPEGPDESGDEHNFDTSQIITHVAVALSFHWYIVAKALGHERPTLSRPPEGVESTGKKRNSLGAGGWSGASAEELRTMLRDTSERFLKYLDTLPEELDDTATARFGIFGELSARGWLLVAVAHPAQHVEQIRRMQAQPDYPGD